jgi:hypothetical protein
MIASLPSECGLQILSNLDAIDLGKCGRVSKTWQVASADDSLWKKCFPEIKFPQGISAKEYVYKHSVRSYEEIVQRVQEFAMRVPLDVIGEFSCIFPFETDCTVKAKVGYGSGLLPFSSGVVERAIFLKRIDKTRDYTNRFSSYSESEHESQTVTIFNIRINPRKMRRSLKKYNIVLPYNPEDSNSNLSTRIGDVLKSRVQMLEVEDKRRDRNYLIGTIGIAAFAVVLVALALNRY